MYEEKREIILHGMVIASSIALIVLAPLLVAKSFKGTAEVPYLLPQSFPIFSLAMIALISAWSLFRIFFIGKKPVENERADPLQKKSMLRVLVTLIILVLGWFVIQVIGMIATTVLVPAALLIHFGVKDWKTILVLCGLMALFTYIFFQVGLKIPLPEGFLFYR